MSAGIAIWWGGGVDPGKTTSKNLGLFQYIPSMVCNLITDQYPRRKDHLYSSLQITNKILQIILLQSFTIRYQKVSE